METSLLWWAIVFLIVALIAGVFGFGIISGLSIGIAKWLFIIFIVLFIISIIFHFLRRI